MTYWRLPTSEVIHLFRECLGKSARFAIPASAGRLCKSCLARRDASHLMRAIRNRRGQFVAPAEAVHVARQLGLVAPAEPRMPDWSTRPRHWHEDCKECYGEEARK